MQLQIQIWKLRIVAKDILGARLILSLVNVSNRLALKIT